MLILLMIGKIICIVLLIIAILIAVVLLVPMRYRFVGESSDKKADFILRWLFGLVSFRAGYHESFQYGLRIAGIRILPRTKKKKKKKTDASSETEEEPEKEKKKKTIPDRIKQGIHVLRSFHEEGVAAAFFPDLQKFLVRIRPRTIKGTVAFGFTDPATTGQVCGGLALVPFVFATDLDVQPDFETEKTYLDGDVRIRGHIFIIHVILFVFAMFRKKEIRRFLHVIRKKNKKQ